MSDTRNLRTSTHSEAESSRVVFILADSDRTGDATHEVARALERSVNE